jgi:ribosomal protein S18 acetylase RimI-like enzyme
MNFRNPEPKDLEQINEIMNLSFSKIYAHYAKKSFSGLQCAIIVEEDSLIIGAINYRIFNLKNSNIGYLYYLAIHPEKRRKGLAKELTRRSINAIVDEYQASEIYAAAEGKNKASKALIAQLGFTHVTKSEMKVKFGSEKNRLFQEMNLMPWEELYVLETITYKQ